MSRLADDLDGIRRATKDEGQTVEELCLELGHSREWVRTRLKLLKNQGRLKVGSKPDTRLDGRNCTVPVYRVEGK